jgi:hypothetical protein
MSQYGDSGIAAEPKFDGKSISAAIEAFLAQHGTEEKDGYHRHLVGFSTYRKYRNPLRKLESFCQANSIQNIKDLGLEQLDAFRAGRIIGARTNRNELQVFRKFWTFCLKRKWVLENVAKDVDAPKNIPENKIQPYTPLEESRILTACDTFGRTPYERLRAKAMTQLHRFTALAISDVATLERSRVEWDKPSRCWRVMVRRLKTSSPSIHRLAMIPRRTAFSVSLLLSGIPHPVLLRQLNCLGLGFFIVLPVSQSEVCLDAPLYPAPQASAHRQILQGKPLTD